MNLMDKEVKHESFGIGRVIKSDDSFIEVEFPSGNRKFVFPDAFKAFLTVNDQVISKEIEKLLEEREVEQLEEEKKDEEERKLKLKRRQIKLEQEKNAKNHRSDPSLQAVFWCETEEVEKVFQDWNVFTGLIKSGAKKGQPNKLVRLNNRSACLITTRESDTLEENRRIRGLYMVDEMTLGRASEDGYIPAHSKYRLRLSEKESEKLLFWNYYVNKRSPEKITWNTGRYRYFENVIMAQILRDIISLKEDPDEREFAEDLFEYFCEINLINKDELPKPNGTLIRTQDQ